MDNQNKETPQGLITNETVKQEQQVPVSPVPQTQAKPTQPVKGKKFNFKMDKKTLIIVAIVVVVLMIVFALSGKGGKGLFGGGKNNQVDPNAKNIVAVDVDTTWGKKYAEVSQELFYNYLLDGKEQNIDRFDVAFINVDFTDAPEMLIKYRDVNNKEYFLMYYYNKKNRLKESKHFTSFDIKLLYSYQDGDANWYVNIINGNINKYGTYTMLSKVVAETVIAPDIKATNDKELNDFSENYAVSDYKIIFYEVKKESFEKDYRTIYDRVYEYANAIDAEKENLKNQYGKEEKKEIDTKPYLVVGNYKLVYGDYKYSPMKRVDGSFIESKYSNTTIKINNNKTISIGNTVHKYTMNGNVINLDDGSVIKVSENDEFTFDVEGGILFKAVRPYDYFNPENNANVEETTNGNTNVEQPKEEEKNEEQPSSNNEQKNP